MTRAASDGTLAAIFAVCLTVLAMFIWQVPAISAWLNALYPLAAPIRATGACTLPSELERLHIVVYAADGKLAVECMYLGPKGAYVRRGGQ